MAYCENCKEERPDDQSFCATCGAALKAPSPDQLAAAQPVQQQYEEQMKKATGFFNQLSLGLQIAGVGAVVSFLFSLITTIQITSSATGLLLGAVGFGGLLWLGVIVSAVCAVVIYSAATKVGKPRIMLAAAAIGLGCIWIPGLFLGFNIGLYFLSILGGVAQVVGGFIDLNENA